MESTKLTKVKLSTLRGQEGAESAPAATPSGSLGSLASLPSSFLGARLRPSARISATLRLRAVGLSVLRRLSVRSVASFPRSPSARAFCPFLPPQPPHKTMRGVCRWVAPSLSLLRGGVRSLRSVSPRGVSAFGGLASAWAVAPRASLYHVPGSNIHYEPCGVFVVRRSLEGRQQ